MKLKFLNLLIFLLLFTLSIKVVAQNEAAKLQVVQAVSPVYPNVAVAARANGNVIVEVNIDSHGKVTSTRIVEGIRLLGAAAEKSARRWVFTPAMEQTETRTALLAFAFKLLPEDASADEVLPIFMPPYHIEIRRAAPKVVDTRNVDPPLPKQSVKYNKRKS